MSRAYLSHPEYTIPDLWEDFSLMRPALNRIFRESRTNAGYPGLNVYADENHVIVTGEIPGVDPEDLNLSLEEGVLTLKFSKKGEDAESRTFLRKERLTGSFARDIQLPYRVNGDKIEAVVKNGVLKISLPRAEEDRPRKITVKAN